MNQSASRRTNRDIRRAIGPQALEHVKGLTDGLAHHRDVLTRQVESVTSLQVRMAEVEHADTNTGRVLDQHEQSLAEFKEAIAKLEAVNARFSELTRWQRFKLVWNGK